MCECCLGARCIISWSSYGLKRVISCQKIFGFSLFFLVLCVPAHENHKDFQVCNTPTTTYFPGRNNNDNKHREKPNNKLWGKDVVGDIPILNMFMIYRKI